MVNKISVIVNIIVVNYIDFLFRFKVSILFRVLLVIKENIIFIY